MPLEIKKNKRGDLVILDLTGSVDPSSAQDLEKVLTESLDGGACRFVIDLRAVDLLTSAGIRVFLMLSKRLEGSKGRFVLSGVSDSLKTVLDVAGFKDYFPTAATKEEAARTLSAARALPAARPSSERPSRLSELVLALVRRDPMNGTTSKRPKRDRKDKSRLSALVVELLRGANSNR